MSSKTQTTATKEEAEPALVPKLRFPEFLGAEGWTVEVIGHYLGESRIPSSLNDPTKRITVRLHLQGVEHREHRGTESTESTNNFCRKAGQFIYGKQNIHKGSFGIVPAHLDGFETSQDLPCFDFKRRCHPLWFYYHLSRENVYCALELRMTGTGSKRLNEKTFLALPIAAPDYPEQQTIAECLSSVDELMAAQARKVDALKTHKKGLMQQLFPREGETQPRLRFPEFQNAGEWAEDKLDDQLHFQDGFAFKSTDFVKSKEDATQVIRITDINNHNTNEDKVYIPSAFLEANKLGKYRVDDGDLLLSLTGAAGFNFFFWDGGTATINQRTAKVTAKKKSNRALLRLLEPLIHEKINARGEGQNNNLSKEFLSSIVLVIPEPDEQQRIADCLTSLDDLIAAQTQKNEALKTHKKGLMQQLFPSPEAAEQPPF